MVGAPNRHDVAFRSLRHATLEPPQPLRYRPFHWVRWTGTSEQSLLLWLIEACGAPDQISVCSEISSASSTSMPRYFTVDSSLDCTKVPGALVDLRRLGFAHRVGAVVCAVQADIVDPMSQDPRVLPGPEAGRIMHAAGEQEILRFQPSLLDSRLHSLPCGRCDFKLNRALGLELHDGGSCRDLVAVTNISNPEIHEITTAQLAVNAQVEEGTPRFPLKLRGLMDLRRLG